MSFSNYKGYVGISTGISNGRSVHQSLMKGRITVSGTDSAGQKITRVVQVAAGEIMDNILRVDDKVVHRIAYGRFEAEVTPTRRNVVRFNKNKGTGRHGKSIFHCDLFAQPAIVETWYKIGRLVRQKVTYAKTGKLCYEWTGRSQKELVVYDGHPMFSGEVLYRITGHLNISAATGYAFLDGDMKDWFTYLTPVKVERSGQVWYAGEMRHGEKVGRWIEDGKVVFYEHGVAIPEKLFNTTPDKLDLKKLLKIPNAQLRMAMLEKARGDRSFGKRLAALGRVIHRDGTMRLFEVKGLENRVLLVQCPSTGSRYYINVPLDSKTCEAARQWTFHLGAGVRLEGRNEIKFSQET